MTDQDPPIEPLRRLDPAEPDEQDLGRLERIDPDAEEASADAPAVTGSRPPTGAGTRLRDGLSAAITLAVLLSLSSIAAIGGLVAVSMRTVAPATLEVAPVDTGAPVTTIRVEASAPQGPRGDEEARPEPEPAVQADVAVVVPAPAPAPPAEGGGNGGGGKAEDDSAGGRSAPRSVGGAWCDAREGGSCDVAVGGGVYQPATVPEDDEGYEDDEETGPPGHSKH